MKLWERCIELCNTAGKIHAIKLWRDETNMGLKESKDAVDALWYRHLVSQRDAFQRQIDEIDRYRNQYRSTDDVGF